MDLYKNHDFFLSNTEKGKIFRVIIKYFSYGFKIDSFIELLRFRDILSKEYGYETSMSDKELKEHIQSCGILFDKKVYVISDDTKNKIRNEVDSALLDGVEMVFYVSFYEKHRMWLFSERVVSEKMLKFLFVSIFPKYSYKENYFLIKKEIIPELSKIKKEIIRIWGKDTLLSYEEISKRLPYIPLHKIKNVLTKNSEFIWNSAEIYTHLSKVDVNDEECKDIVDYVVGAYQKCGYAAISDIPLREIQERNYELTLTAMHKAIFEIALADKYTLHGKIITRKDDELDLSSLMKEYCRTVDKCSLQDLIEFQKDLTGASYRWIPMEAGCSVMVRIDKDNYIAEKYVHFDVEAIDDVLDRFVNKECQYLPLQSITTFALFPHCGQAWNLFLLESYCRRFSVMFRFEALASNSKNVGAIVRKSCPLSYAQIMADAVAESDTVLEKVSLEEFLYKKGYIGKSSYSKSGELIKLAKDIRRRKS
jgi:uncharacterized protein (UPF0248 family)